MHISERTRESISDGIVMLVIIICVIILAGGMNTGCHNDRTPSGADNNNNLNNTNQNNNNNNNSTPDPGTFNVKLSSLGYITCLTSEGPDDAEGEYCILGENRVFDVPFTPPGAFIVTGEHDLEVDADENLEIWEIPYEEVTRFEDLVRTYVTSWSWEPDLFPASRAGATDLKILLTMFLCSENVEMPDIAPRVCPDEFVPSSFFRQVSGNGYYYWEYVSDNDYVDGVKVLIGLRRYFY